MERRSESTSENIAKAGVLSLVVAVALMGIKFYAYHLTGSQAIFSDAMEGVVNVLAASFALFSVHFASLPADRDHPYGHGKIEFISAAFEGGMIALASLLICAKAVQGLIVGHSAERLGIGIAISAGAGACNAILGFYLLNVGRKKHSSAIEASGQHVLSDFWTSAGIAIALLGVQLTGWSWLDSAAALVVGLLLAKTGVTVARESVGGLLDEEKGEILMNLVAVLKQVRPQGIIQVHHARVIRSGSYHHIDAHAVVPQFWDVSEAHKKTESFEQELMRNYPYQGELHLHIDPCRQAYCANCAYASCPIRLKEFIKEREISIAELTDPEEPSA